MSLFLNFNLSNLKVKAKNISGGQFKRLIIAMALVNEPNNVACEILVL